MSAVVAFPGERVTFEEGWNLLPSTMRRRSDAKDKVRKLWMDHARRAGGQDALLAALRRYLKGDTDLPRTGGPGLQVWLRAGRYDHWQQDEAQAVADAATVVAFADERMRASFHERFEDEKARRWFDRCALEGDTLVAPWRPKPEWLQGPFKAWALSVGGIGGYRFTD